jgi:TPR repeat protein
LDQKSITAFRQRADNGDAAAKCGLGLMYAQGKGVPQDYAQAAAWWRKAAEQGIYLTQSMLGHLYQKGQGVPQDYAQAALWYRKAAGLGDVDARGKLGAFYMMGQGVPQDYAEAYFWSDLAAAGKQEAPQAEAVTTIRDEAASHLTPADLSRVQERARKWFEAHQAKPQ